MFSRSLQALKYSSRSFTILGKYDLNLRPALKQSCGLSHQKVVCCGPCKSDPIIVHFSTPKSIKLLNLTDAS